MKFCGWEHDDREGHFEKMFVMSKEESMFSSSRTSRGIRVAVICMALVAALGVGVVTPALASGPLQTAPIEGSIFPALVQIGLIVLVTEGIKSLLKAFTNGQTVLAGREAAIAYVIVGLTVYVTQTYLLPILPPGVEEAVTNILSMLAMLLAGSGLFSMTSAFRAQNE